MENSSIIEVQNMKVLHPQDMGEITPKMEVVGSHGTDGYGFNLVSSMGKATSFGTPKKSPVCRPKNNARFVYGPSRPKQQRFVWYSNRIFYHDWPGPNSFIMKKLRFHNRRLMHPLILNILKSPPKKCNSALGVFVGCMAVQAAHGGDSES